MTLIPAGQLRQTQIPNIAQNYPVQHIPGIGNVQIIPAAALQQVGVQQMMPIGAQVFGKVVFLCHFLLRIVIHNKQINRKNQKFAC